MGPPRHGEHDGSLGLPGDLTAGELRRLPRVAATSSVLGSLTGGVG